MLVVLPGVGLVVSDVSVVHRAATKSVRSVAQSDGAAAAARDTANRAKYGVGEFSPFLCYIKHMHAFQSYSVDAVYTATAC